MPLSRARVPTLDIRPCENNLPPLDHTPNPPFPTSHKEEAQYCGSTGTVLKRAAIEGPKKGSYHIHTMGCQMNLADSERMAGVLGKNIRPFLPI